MSPNDAAKFDRMATGLFPDEARGCKGFVRHKDLLISPSQLRTHNIPYMQVRAGAILCWVWQALVAL